MRFIHVSADNNNAPVLNNLMNNNCVAVQYYMDGCHYCNLLKPHWAKMNSILKNQYQGDIIVARVNANAVSNVNNSTNISGYPTIRYLENGNNISEFNDERNAENLIRWLSKHSKHKLQKRKHAKTKRHKKHMKGGSKHRKRTRNASKKHKRHTKRNKNN